MRPLSRPHAWGLLLIGLITLPARGDDGENWTRLQAMPREYRRQLYSNLERFDLLSPQEQAAVRALDARLATHDAADQARYHGVLRRYHAWFSSLPKADQDAIKAAASDADRIAIVNKLHERDRRKRKSAGAPTQPKLLGIEVGDLGAVPPYEMGSLLRVWFALTPEEQKDINQTPNLNGKLNKLRARGFQKGIPVDRFPENQERELLARIEKDPIYCRDLTNLIERANKAREAQVAKKKIVAPARGRQLQAVVESLYFAEHPPARVEPARLARFDASLPEWFRETFDSMGPEGVRSYLTILYRQIYPNGQEMPAPKPAAEKPAEPSKKAAPATPAKPGAAAPF